MAVVGRSGETSTFVGRADSIQLIDRLLSESSLITLTGEGGVGKSRLAREAAAAFQDRFPGGVVHIDLPVTEGNERPADELDHQILSSERVSSLVIRASASPVLVVLDNCETWLTQAAAAVTELLNGDLAVAPTLTVLATSRIALGHPAERVVRIQPLLLPPDDAPATIKSSPAVKLFLNRAASLGVDWPSNDRNLAAVGRIVNQLDGLPLAIELAAARSNVLAPEQLVELLHRSLDLLVAEPRSSTQHAGLRACIEASYQPLSSELKQAFELLCLFAEPFDLATAHAVLGPETDNLTTLSNLSALVDRSLLAVRTGASGRTSYRTLASIRAFGREALSGREGAENAWERFVNGMVLVADDLVGRGLDSFTPELLDAIADNVEHLIVAISWCVDHDVEPDRAYRLFLLFYGPAGARHDVVEIARRMRKRWPDPAPLRPEAWAVMGLACYLTGDSGEARRLSSDAAQAPERTELGQMIALRTLGCVVAASDGESHIARAHFAAAAEIAKGFSTSFARELAITRAAAARSHDERIDSIEVLDLVGREAANEGETINVVWSATTAVGHHLVLGDTASAARCVAAALSMADRTGLPWSVAMAHRAAAELYAIETGWDAALDAYRRALESCVKDGDIEGVAITMRSVAGAAAWNGAAELAARLWAASPPVRGLPVQRSVFHPDQERLRAKLGSPVALDLGTLVTTARQLLNDRPELPLGPIGACHAPEGFNGRSAVLCFDGYEFDVARHELRHHGVAVHIEPQVFDVLRVLIARRGELVTVEQLLDEVWGDRFVSKSAVSSRILTARRAVGDDGRRQAVIKTVPRRGFIFVADVAMAAG